MINVGISKCCDYDYENVKESCSSLMADIGGIEKYITPNSSVFVKMNLLMKKKPEEATTTHPMLLKVLCEELLKINCKVIVGDSPGGIYNEKILKGIYKTCGVEDAVKDLDVKLNYDVSEIRVINDKAKLAKYITVIKPITEVDHVISLCKLKTHMMATFTGGVKNLFGIIPGILKAEYHFKMPKIEDFTDLLVDICEYVNPSLTIMDGIVGMEGEGPSAGNPKKVGILIASKNPYALDVIACKCINLDPIKVPTIMRCIERGILDKNFSDIVVCGNDINEVIIKDFKVPNVRSISFLKGILPQPIERRVNNFINPKPIFLKEKCVKCGDCEKACPPKVIKIDKNGPTVDLDNCIRCFCCHELCPKKAVKIKERFLFKHLR